MTKRTIDVELVEACLESLLDDLAAGDEIVVRKAGKPVARLVPFEPTKRRKPGLLRGKAWAAPDAWDPDPELDALFYDGDPRFPSILDARPEPAPTTPSGKRA